MNNAELVKRARQLLSKPTTAVAVPSSDPPIRSGSRIEWEQADLSIHSGVVDFVHVDTDGQAWAFVTIGESWAAVNMKIVRVLSVE